MWPEGAATALQDCFDFTDWEMFREAATIDHHTDIQEYTETVTAYFNKCTDDVTVSKTMYVPPETMVDRGSRLPAEDPGNCFQIRRQCSPHNN